MSVKKIVKVWHNGLIISDNIKFLQEKTKNVFFPLTESSNSIINDLIDTYKKTPCAGIAANQIGYNKSIFIGIKDYIEEIDEEELEKKESQHDEKSTETNEYADNYEIYINPAIDGTSNKSIQEEIEGCLSIPQLSLRIQRFNKIKVRYYDGSGGAIKKSLSGFLSKLFQHELDHLNGVLMPSREVLEGFIAKDSSLTPELYSELQSHIK